MSHKSDTLLVVDKKFKNLPHKIYEIQLKELTKEILHLSSDEYEIRYSEGSSKGDNYIGIIYRAEIIQNKSVKMSIIIKLPPSNPTRREEFFLHRSFVHESDFYENLFPMYKKFQQDKNIDIENDGFSQVPFCYRTITSEPFEGLYFEDLKVKGFEVYDRNKELTKEHVMLVMQVLAKMHAIFYCIKEQNPDLVDVYRKRNDYFIMRCEREGSLMKSWYEDSRDQALEVIEKCENPKLIKKVQAILSNDILTLFKSCLNLDMTEPYATLCHGDCWNNNLMYRHDENGFPNDIRFLDFQIMRYASPVCDLMYYIFSCTTKSLRDKYYQEFINCYYDSLSRFIDRLGSNPKKIFPRHAFDDHIKKFGKFGLIMGVLVLPVFTSDVDNVPDMDEFVTNLNGCESINGKETGSKGVCYVTTKTYPVYAERLLGVCEDLFNYGYI